MKELARFMCPERGSFSSARVFQIFNSLKLLITRTGSRVVVSDRLFSDFLLVRENEARRPPTSLFLPPSLP